MAKPKLPIPVTLLTGYLGSGKTTLINHVLGNQEGYKCAVIVNDIGEVNIDAELIQKAGVVTQKDDNLVPLSNGCICCTLKVDLINQIAELVKSGKFDYILIEASGICEPLPIAQSIAVLEGDEEEGTPAICRLDNIVTVVDALRMATEFGCGDNLLKDDVDEEDIESLVIQQIEFCSTIILNKVDMVNEEQLGRVKAMIRTLQPKAKIIEANYGKVSVGDILNTNLYDFEETAGSAGWAQAYDKDEDEKNEHHDHDEDEHEHHHHDEDEQEHHHHDEDEHEHHHHHDDEDHSHCDHEHGHCCHHHHHGDDDEEYGICTFVYHSRRPFNQEKLQEFVNNWPKGVVRARVFFGSPIKTREITSMYLSRQAYRLLQQKTANGLLHSLRANRRNTLKSILILKNIGMKNTATVKPNLYLSVSIWISRILLKDLTIVLTINKIITGLIQKIESTLFFIKNCN